MYGQGSRIVATTWDSGSLQAYSLPVVSTPALAVDGALTVGGNDMTLLSSLRQTPLTKTADYALAATDMAVVMNAAGHTVTLPTAASCAGMPPRVIKNGASGSSTTVASAGGTIDGASTQTLSAAFASLRVFSDGTNWLLA